MSKPSLVICAGEILFDSFFGALEQRRLSRLFRWVRVDPKVLRRGAIGNADALVTTWDSPSIEADVSETAPRLRMIAHCGGEVKSRYAPALFERLTITNAALPMARATAEMAAAFLLYSARNVDFYRAQLRKRSNRVYSDVHFTGGPGETLLGREVSMIGFGRIGRALADLLRGFDVRWLVFDPYAPRDLAARYPVRFAGLSAVLKRGSLLVLTAALTDETRGLLDREKLAMLPDGAFVINVARGGLVDMRALVREVRSRRLRCAVDVTDPEEPLPLAHPLRNMPGAIVTPHVGGGGRQVRREIARTVIDDLERFFRGEVVENRVTPPMLGRMT